MIISSELTGKTYKTVEDCIAAEKEFFRKKEEEEKAKEAYLEELDKAYTEAIEACERYFEIANINVDIDKERNSVTISERTTDNSDGDNRLDLFWKLIFG